MMNDDIDACTSVFVLLFYLTQCCIYYIFNDTDFFVYVLWFFFTVVVHKQRDIVPLDINDDMEESDEDAEIPVLDFEVILISISLGLLLHWVKTKKL